MMTEAEYSRRRQAETIGAALFPIVREALADYSEREVTQAIRRAHMAGAADGDIVTRENLHLFRQYRNAVSGDPAALIREALA